MPMLSPETTLTQFTANVLMATSFLLKTEAVCQEFLGLKIGIDVAAIKDKNEQTNFETITISSKSNTLSLQYKSQ